MSRINFCRPFSNPWAHLIAGIFLAAGGRLLAADPLSAIPSNAAGVMVFRHVDEAIKHFNLLANSVCSDSGGVDLEDFESAFNIEAGTIDPSKPVAIIFMRPAMNASSSVIAFVPKDPEQYREDAGRGMVARRYEGPDGEAFANFRGGVAMVGPNRRAIRAARMNAGGFFKGLDAEQRELYEHSDVFVHLPLAKWREEKITPMFLLASSFMKLFLTETGKLQEESTVAFFDLLVTGFRQITDEMQSLTVSLRLDDRVIRMVHHHDFKPDGVVAQYLGQMQRTEGNLFAELPDSPFVFALAANWRNAHGQSISSKLMSAVSDLKPPADDADRQARKELVQTVNDYYNQSSGTYMLIGPTPGKSLPMLMYGGYIMDDAPKSLEQFRIIQERMGLTLGSLMPGGGMFGTPQVIQRQGRTYLEMPLLSDTTNPVYRKRAEAFYGAAARFQKTTGDGHHLIYAISEPPQSVDDVLHVQESKRTLANNPMVKRALDQLPANRAHSIMLVNLSQMFQSLPGMNTLSISGAQAHLPRLPADHGDGPILGWALVAEKDAITGHMAINQQDAVSFCQSVRKMADHGTPQIEHPRRPAPPKPAAPPTDDDDHNDE